MVNPIIRVVTDIVPNEFRPLLVPVDCNYYLLKNKGPDPLFMRSDEADAGTEDDLQPGWTEMLTAPWIFSPAVGQIPNFRPVRYKAGCRLYYIKGTGPLITKFWL